MHGIQASSTLNAPYHFGYAVVDQMRLSCGGKDQPSNTVKSTASAFPEGEVELASRYNCTYCSVLGLPKGCNVKYQACRLAVVAVGDAVYSLESKLLMDSAGKEVLLRAKSSQVLAFLIERAGKLVSRDAIFEFVWADLEVSDDSLTQCISGIRRAIGDRGHKVLQTVSKRGYILNVEVPDNQELQSEHLTTTEAPKIPPFPTRPETTCVFIDATKQQIAELFKQLNQTSMRHIDFTQVDAGALLKFQSAGVALDCVFSMLNLASYSVGIAGETDNADQEARMLSKVSAPGAITVSLKTRDATISDPRLRFEDLGEIHTDFSPTHGQKTHRAFQASRDQFTNSFGLIQGEVLPTIAILPMRNGIGGGDPGALGLLFSNAITQEMSRSHEVNVISSMSTAPFSRNNLGLTDIRRLLNVDFVLSGFWTEIGGTVRFDYEFADALTQRVLWADSIVTTTTEVLGCFDASSVVAGQIRKAIVLNETLKIQSEPLETLTAYSILYGAIGLMHRFSPADFKQSKHLLDALTKDNRDHPAPLAWTARWYLLKAVQGWSDDPIKDSELAFECTARALDIDPNNTLALVSEGQILTHLKRSLDDAEHRYDTALETNPNDANGRMSRAMLLAFADRGSEGLADANRSLELSPLDPHRFLNLAMAAGVNLSAGNNDVAVDLARASYKINRTHTSTLRTLAVAEVRTGNLIKAKKAASELLQLQPDLKVSKWLAASPSAHFANGQEFAADLRSLGVPD
ncbi:MAG: DNA-binding winged helix-turn-helix (wHTH) protein/TolB-like protein [Candidatus Azotimanducaceae bacterium]|jgi:DNA-binding winged helix-turn-helix (wHTH) protein/TolB-like protein/tetratricopeptide (TPR) repeat protein